MKTCSDLEVGIFAKQRSEFMTGEPCSISFSPPPFSPKKTAIWAVGSVVCFVGVEVLMHGLAGVPFTASWYEALTAGIEATFSFIIFRDIMKDTSAQIAIKLIASIAADVIIACLIDPTGLSMLSALLHHATDPGGLLALMVTYSGVSALTDTLTQYVVHGTFFKPANYYAAEGLALSPPFCRNRDTLSYSL
jgi:hypothetical protein